MHCLIHIIHNYIFNQQLLSIYAIGRMCNLANNNKPSVHDFPRTCVMRLDSLSFIKHRISNNCKLFLLLLIFFLLECIILQYFVKSVISYIFLYLRHFFFLQQNLFLLLYLRSKYSWSNWEKCRNRIEDMLISLCRVYFRLSDPEAMQNGSRFICVLSGSARPCLPAR